MAMALSLDINKKNFEELRKRYDAFKEEQRKFATSVRTLIKLPNSYTNFSQFDEIINTIDKYFMECSNIRCHNWNILSITRKFEIETTKLKIERETAKLHKLQMNSYINVNVNDFDLKIYNLEAEMNSKISVIENEYLSNRKSLIDDASLKFYKLMESCEKHRCSLKKIFIDTLLNRARNMDNIMTNRIPKDIDFTSEDGLKILSYVVKTLKNDILNNMECAFEFSRDSQDYRIIELRKLNEKFSVS